MGDGTKVDTQLLKERRAAMKMLEGSWEHICPDGQGFESMNVRDYRCKRVVGSFVTKVES